MGVDVEQVKDNVRHGRIDVERLVELVVKLQQQLQAAKQQLDQARQRID